MHLQKSIIKNCEIRVIAHMTMTNTSSIVTTLCVIYRYMRQLNQSVQENNSNLHENNCTIYYSMYVRDIEIRYKFNKPGIIIRCPGVYIIRVYSASASALCVIYIGYATTN